MPGMSSCPASDNLIWAGDQDAIVAEIQAFVTGVRPAPEPRRVLATVLFTDIVGSTQRAAELGDVRWHALLADHNRVVRRQLDRFGGREVKVVGDGFLATFDGPARAVRCAIAIRDDVRELGLEIRAGIHVGEIEVLPDDIAGLAVHLGARVSALAGAGEVLVSSTVKDLVVGSGHRRSRIAAATSSRASRASGGCSPSTDSGIAVVMEDAFEAIPLGRAALPDDIADLVSMLCHGTYVTGETLVISRGLFVR